MKQKNGDPLKDLFSLMPQERLPESFRNRMMQKIMAEAERVRKRNERWGWFALIAASLLMIGSAVGTLLYMDVPPVNLSFPDLAEWSFSLHIGVLVLILLGADYKFRQFYRKRQEKRTQKS